ncbi:MAG TPA: MOSC domain-containing protein [Solirubrobacterales bacterium]|nr:MOSC domain-containing protein [Solirubrobacterales bacterium]
MPSVLSVNVGRPRPISYRGEQVMTGIFKQPVRGRIAARGTNLDGDEQGNPKVHGGLDKAIYAYSREDYAWWEEELAESMEPGTFGENLTTTGLELNDALIGERWRVGTALLEVSEPRFPCFKLGVRMGTQRFVKRFAAARRTGTYLRIRDEGEFGKGDSIDVVTRPDHGVTIGSFAEAYLGDRDRLDQLLAADQLSNEWRSWIEEQLRKRRQA